MAHDLIVMFCSTFERLYGKDMCSPNVHMVCHLKDILHDCGPVHGYWCFSFERYSDMLEAMQNAWANPEKQLMLKSMDLQLVNSIDNSASRNEHILSVLRYIAVLRNMSIAGSSCTIEQMAYKSIDLFKQLSSHSGPTCDI